MIEIIKLKGSGKRNPSENARSSVYGFGIEYPENVSCSLRQFGVHFLINDFGRFKCEAGDRMCHSMRSGVNRIEILLKILKLSDTEPNQAISKLFALRSLAAVHLFWVLFEKNCVFQINVK